MFFGSLKHKVTYYCWLTYRMPEGKGLVIQVPRVANVDVRFATVADDLPGTMDAWVGGNDKRAVESAAAAILRQVREHRDVWVRIVGTNIGRKCE